MSAVKWNTRQLAGLGLRKISDKSPGLTRKKVGRGFAYFDATGEKLTDKPKIERIKSLAIPPAWTDVWISPFENSFLQATGRDAKGRKQAIYHPDWTAGRQRTKYKRLAAFGQALPGLRRQVSEDLRRRGLDRRRVLAAVVQLLEESLIRVGNERYAKTNKSFGLTTLRNRHVKVGKDKISFKFKGKSGKKHEISVQDSRVASIVRKCLGLPGARLFEYRDEQGAVQHIDSADVNAYIREATGEDFTAKDFRTWVATVEAVKLFRENRPKSKREVNDVLRLVAAELGNTPSVCRKSYILPRVLESGRKAAWLICPKPPRDRKFQPGIERLTLRYLLK